MSFHKNLVGTDLHIGRAMTGSGSPVGIVTPGIIGQFFFDTAADPHKLYVAFGLNDTDWTLVSSGASQVPTETGEQYPIPEARVSTDTTRADQTSLEGAAFIIRRPMVFNRIIFRVATVTGSPTITLQVFQNVDGLSGIADRIATVQAFALVGTGNKVATIAEGDVTMKAGICYVLTGRDSGSGTYALQTYTTQAVNLLTSNVDTDTHPLIFTTAIAATTAPSTFDPRANPTGQAIESAGNLTPVVRFKKV